MNPPFGLHGLIEYVRWMARRPGMYDISNVRGIWLFWYGYRQCVCAVDGDENRRILDFDEKFEKYLAKQFDTRQKNWCDLLEERSLYLKEDSIELFVRTLNEYLSTRSDELDTLASDFDPH